MTYAEQLRHPKWQRRRLEILTRACFKCERCEDDETTLHVHHKRYRKGAMAWDYPDDQLIALCEECHGAEHLVRSELTAVLGELNIAELQRVLGFAKSFEIARLWDTERTPEILARSLELKSYDEAAGFGTGLGLSSTESDYLLVGVQIAIGDALEMNHHAFARELRLDKLAARSLAELEAIVDALPLRDTEL